MGFICDFCGERRSMVYCRSDMACLCLLCDRYVHSANVISRRHSRVLLCQKCNSQAAYVRCVQENISLCQNCDKNAHGGDSNSNTSSAHKTAPINFRYSGCPSSSELSQIWSFLLESPCMEDYYDASICELGLVFPTIEEQNSE